MLAARVHGQRDPDRAQHRLVAAGDHGGEGEEAQVEARRQRGANGPAHPLAAPEHRRAPGGEDLDGVRLLDAERSLGVEAGLRHHLDELRTGHQLGAGPRLVPEIGLAHELVGFDPAHVRVVGEDREVAVLPGRVGDRHDALGVQRRADLLQLVERVRHLEAVLTEERAVVVDDDRVGDRGHRDDRAVDRQQLERVGPEALLVVGIVGEDLGEVEHAAAGGDVDGVGPRLDGDDVGRGALGGQGRLHAHPLLVQPGIRRDLQREIGIVSLLVLLGDELLHVDVEADILPERDGGRAARLDLRPLELDRILELARRRRRGGLGPADLGRRAPRPQEHRRRRGGEESQLEQAPPRHPAACLTVRLTPTPRIAHGGLSFSVEDVRLRTT